MKNITDLRDHLFDQLDRLSVADGEELDKELSKAAAIVQVSEAIIKSAEVENSFIQITKAIGSGFIPAVVNGEKLIDKEKQFDVNKEKNWIAEQ